MTNNYFLIESLTKLALATATVWFVGSAVVNVLKQRARAAQFRRRLDKAIAVHQRTVLP